MTQNIYDDPAFFEGYSGLGRSVEGLAGAAEWPALRAMLPELSGLRVADLGCGFGWFCRYAGEQDAASVQGFDVSEKMLARARAETSDPAISYERADLETITLPTTSLDLVYSSLAFHYVEALERLFGNIHRALVPDGHLVFSIEHPIFMASRRPEWMLDADGNRTWPVDSYQMEGKRTTNWLADGVVKQHRTIGTLLNMLIRQGFTLTHIEDFGPTEEQIAERPELAEERERPMFLLVSARR
ncbi:MAG: class I SAM-dependent methyltransferase [Shinella sp.]|nr:class I SAM-dependent methyltransferase [Shinella sp.]